MYAHGFVLARRVNDVDSELLRFSGHRGQGVPVAEGSRALDSDTLLAFKLHAIHLCAHIVTTADLMNISSGSGYSQLLAHFVDIANTASVVQNALREGRLARVDMG